MSQQSAYRAAIHFQPDVMRTQSSAPYPMPAVTTTITQYLPQRAAVTVAPASKDFPIAVYLNGPTIRARRASAYVSRPVLMAVVDANDTLFILTEELVLHRIQSKRPRGLFEGRTRVDLSLLSGLGGYDTFTLLATNDGNVRVLYGRKRMLYGAVHVDYTCLPKDPELVMQGFQFQVPMEICSIGPSQAVALAEHGLQFVDLATGVVQLAPTPGLAFSPELHLLCGTEEPRKLYLVGERPEDALSFDTPNEVPQSHACLSCLL
jgi:hypothetical protein